MVHPGQRRVNQLVTASISLHLISSCCMSRTATLPWDNIIYKQTVSQIASGDRSQNRLCLPCNSRPLLCLSQRLYHFPIRLFSHLFLLLHPLLRLHGTGDTLLHHQSILLPRSLLFRSCCCSLCCRCVPGGLFLLRLDGEFQSDGPLAGFFGFSDPVTDDLVYPPGESVDLDGVEGAKGDAAFGQDLNIAVRQ
jgi:hypothetical protein